MLKNKKKGFSLVEIVVVIAIMIVLLAVLVPSLLKYVENSRMQRDDSAMDEVCNSVQLAMADSETFDEVFSYSIPNNYTTYTDSSGVYGARYTDEEYWAPDGGKRTVTITFNPNESGDYVLADANINDMTSGNGSLGEPRTTDASKICKFENMGNQKLYSAVKKVVDNTIFEESATYRNSSYTIFIIFTLENGLYRPDITGSYNGTNLYSDAPAAPAPIPPNDTPEESTPSQPTQPQTPVIPPEDLGGGGTITFPDNPTPPISENLQTGDIYTHGFYEYRYNQYYSGGAGWVTDENQNGWGVRVIDRTLPAYGDMLTEINGKPITNLQYTFGDCYALETSGLPSSIPPTVTNMSYIFRHCSSLTTLGTITIPDGITNMDYAFDGCINLTEGVHLPNSVTSASLMYCNCYKLVTYQGNPNSNGDFSDYELPSALTDLNGFFRNCTSIIKAPKINSSVTRMAQTFYGCTSLTTAPAIPSSVTDMQHTFYQCTALTGTVIINAYPWSYTICFSKVDFEAQNLHLAGTTANARLDSLGATGLNYCADCNGKCLGTH